MNTFFILPTANSFWCDFDTVLAWASELQRRGWPQLVVHKLRGRTNYNMTHHDRADVWNRPDTELAVCPL